MTNTHANQRIALTKRLIKESLLHLLEGKTIFSISVRELCEHAQINRSTFYKHYGSQYDLLAEMEADFLRHIQDMLQGAEMADDENALQQVSAVAAYMDANAALTRMLLNNNLDAEFSTKLFALPSIRTLLGEALGARCGEQTRASIASFIINGAYALLLEWINSDDRQRPEEIAALVLTLARRVCGEGVG